MRNFVNILLITIFLFSSISKTIVWISYKINYNYIKTELCENKDKPKMKCDGKCYLTKQIKKTESNPRNFPESLKLKDDLKFISNQLLNITFIKVDYLKSFISINEFSPNNLYYKIFIPPKIR